MADDPPKIVTSDCCSQSAPAELKMADDICCGPKPTGRPPVFLKIPGGVSYTTCRSGEVLKVPTELSAKDRWDSFKVRLNIGRMDYSIRPGLYAVGNPGAEALVALSANFKLSFDHLRTKLVGRDLWILVLDTKGINVWCAAGKGTFGTEEVVRQINEAGLADVVTHRRVIAPQLGAPGISAHVVKKRTKFAVKYGPVMAEDLPAYLDDGMKATPQMRRVRFGLGARLVLTPVEVTSMAKWGAIAAIVLLLISGLGRDIYSFQRLLSLGLVALGFFVAAYFTGVVVVPALLPWLPGRAFALKGAWAGVLMAAGVGLYQWYGGDWLLGAVDSVAWLLITLAVVSFLAMNFTGTSTYTSLSGVKKEMRVAVPLQIGGASVGLILWITGRFV